MKRRVLVSILVAAVLLIAAGIFIAVLPKAEPKPRSIHAYFHFYESPEREKITALLEDFRSFYPEIDLSYSIEPYRDMVETLSFDLDGREFIEGAASHGIVSVLAADNMDLLPPESKDPSLWISSGWDLYYDFSRLSAEGWDKEALEALSASGLEGFLDDMMPVTSADESVFIVGTSFQWPILLWFQHLQLLAGRGRVPDGYSVRDWNDGIEGFFGLVESGAINKDFASLNFAGSQLGITEGRGLFVLSDPGIYRTYPPEMRDRLDSIPFPGTAIQGWKVGSGVLLAGFTPVSSDAETAAAEGLLLNYLHSEGVSQRFLKDTGIRLLPEKGEAGGLQDIPALNQYLGDSQVQRLMKYRRP